MKNKDLNTLAMLTLCEDLLKKVYTDETKDKFRSDLTITGNEYLTISRSKQPKTTTWDSEAKKAMNEWAISQGFKPTITPEKPNYKITLSANAKATKQLIKMLNIVIQHGDKTVSTLAQDLLNAINQ